MGVHAATIEETLPAAVAEKVEEQVKQTGKFPMLTINARGDVIGDTSGIPAETLEKLQSEDGRAQLRAMYDKEFGSGRREIRRVLQGRNQRSPQAATAKQVVAKLFGEEKVRDFTHLKPPGMSGKEFRKLRRKYLHKQTKSVLKEMRHASN